MGLRGGMRTDLRGLDVVYDLRWVINISGREVFNCRRLTTDDDGHDDQVDCARGGGRPPGDSEWSWLSKLMVEKRRG
jgi:hypothetical protein